jgi:hypothetical protein
MDPRVLAFQFQIGSFVLDRNLASVDHEQSLLAPQPGGNTMNWIVGHVVRTRNQAIGLLGGTPLFDDAEFAQYGAGGCDPNRALPLEELRQRFDALSPAIASALAKATPEQLSQKSAVQPNCQSKRDCRNAAREYRVPRGVSSRTDRLVTSPARQTWGASGSGRGGSLRVICSAGSPMAYDEKLAVRVRTLLKGTTCLQERKLFGGLAFMYRDRMCFGIVGRDLVVRVAADEFDAVMRRRHVRPMDFTGTPLKGFVYVSPPGFRSRPALRAWLERGRRFVKVASARNAGRGRRVRRSLVAKPGSERSRKIGGRRVCER